jgi:hypothetical protein
MRKASSGRYRYPISQFSTIIVEKIGSRSGVQPCPSFLGLRQSQPMLIVILK